MKRRVPAAIQECVEIDETWIGSAIRGQGSILLLVVFMGKNRIGINKTKEKCMTESKQITAQQSFEDNIKDRIRADIGGLIPDGVLAEMVSKAIQTIFFNRLETKTNDRINTTVTPSWFEQEVAKLLDVRIKEDIAKYMDSQGSYLIELAASEIAKQAPNIIAGAFVKFMGSNGGYSNSLDNVILGTLRSRGFKI